MRSQFAVTEREQCSKRKVGLDAADTFCFYYWALRSFFFCFWKTVLEVFKFRDPVPRTSTYWYLLHALRFHTRCLVRLEHDIAFQAPTCHGSITIRHVLVSIFYFASFSSRWWYFAFSHWRSWSEYPGNRIPKYSNNSFTSFKISAWSSGKL